MPLAQAKRYIFDTNIYIAAIRNGPESPEYRLLFEKLPRAYLCSVVSGELHAGCRDDIGLELVKQCTRRMEKTGRIVTPTHASWGMAGILVSRIMKSEPRYKSKVSGLFRDLLIALSATQIGATVYTADKKDFDLIRRCHPFSLQTLSP